jgi:hypothetical protein
MKNYKSITKKHEGKRLLIRRAYTSFEDPIEVGVFEISPSGSYVKLQFIRDDNTSYVSWYEHDKFEVLEVLPSKMDQLSDIVERFNKDLREKEKKAKKEFDKYSVQQCETPKTTDEAYPYKTDSNEYGLSTTSCCQDDPEVQKQKWVHGMCNPPADDVKKYVDNNISTGKKYYSVKEMLEDLNQG